jgi:hypothetical protein
MLFDHPLHVPYFWKAFIMEPLRESALQRNPILESGGMEDGSAHKLPWFEPIPNTE